MMQYRQLGNSSLTLPVVTLGTWQLADSEYWGAGGDPQNAVRSALDHGITCFDSAESYANGESEALLGRALGRERSKVLLATKVSQRNLAPDKLTAACEGSLKRLRTDTIDLYQVHWPSREVSFAETFDALERLRRDGKIRAIGVSNFGPLDLHDWLQSGSAVSNQVCYNALFRAIEFEILPACRSAGVGVLAYSPLLQGILSGRWEAIEDIPTARRRTRHFAAAREGTRHRSAGAEEETLHALRGLADLARETGIAMADLAMAWLIAQPGVTSIIVGGRRPDQVARNARAAEIRLAPDILARIGRLTEPLKQRLGPNADPWLDGADSRIR